jgi:hypothetical protein
MSQTFNERLNQILPKLTSPDLLTNQGLGNEIGFWIFEYPPEEEMAMRDFLNDVVTPGLKKHQPPIRSAEVNLFDFVVSLLDAEGVLSEVITRQSREGNEAVLDDLRLMLGEFELAEKIVTKHPPEQLDMLMLTGVGAVYPMLRTHTLLSALHPHMKDTPLVMFYPGKYDGYSLRLFNKLSEDHYYRAFRLVP